MKRPRLKKQAEPPAETGDSAVPGADPGMMTSAQPGLPTGYLEACWLAQAGKYDEARRAYAMVKRSTARSNKRIRALVENDLVVLSVLEGKVDEARRAWQDAVAVDPDCLLTRLNRDFLEAEISLSTIQDRFGELKLAPEPGQFGGPALAVGTNEPSGDVRRTPLSAGTQASPDRTDLRPPDSPPGPIRVVILSFLFNWPSTSGRNHHTAELAAFLARGGYEVKHYFSRFPGWGIGRVTDELISPSEAIQFDQSSWHVAEIQARFRRAVDAFGPDYVIITDS